MNIIALKPMEAQKILDDWMGTIDSLVDEVSHWAAENEWETRVSNGETTEETLGTYSVPILTIGTPEGRLILEPMDRNPGGEGRVKLIAMPTMSRVRLLHGDREAGWEILTDSGVPLRQPWNKQTFIRLAKDMLGAE